MLEEENEPLLVVLGVLGAVITIVIWWFLSSGAGGTSSASTATTSPETSATAATQPAVTTTSTGAVATASTVTLTLANGITLDGTVPSQDIAESLRAEAVALFGVANVADNFFIDAATTTDGGSLTIIGTVIGEQSKRVVMDGFGPLAIAAGYRLDDQVTVEPLIPSDVLFSLADNGITLTGNVPSATVDSDLEAFALTLDERVDNQLVIDPKTTIEGGEVRFIGEVGTRADAERIVAAYVEALPESLYGISSDLQPATTDLEASLAELFGLDPIEFDSGRAAIRPGEEATLDRAAEALMAHAGSTVEIQGHTDGQGDAVYNLDLSQRRAEAVRDYLIGRGVNAGKLTAVGYGSDQPVADNATAEGRQENRRIAFVER